MKAQHVLIQELEALKKGALTAEKEMKILDHIGECDLCAQAFADLYENEELLPLSPDFSKGVFHKINHNEQIEKQEQRKTVSLKKSTSNHHKKSNQLFAYGFKVSIAACVTLLLLFSGTFGNGMQWIDKGIVQNTDWRGLSQITEKIRDFSDHMLPDNLLNQKGGFNHDQEKK